MTRPRRVLGAQPPGRLAGTMLRVLAAELSDPARFTRAKAYARDGAVIDIDVDPGTVRAEVQGSRYEPYAAELHVRPAPRHELEAVAPGAAAGTELLVPERRELVAWCTCPDDSRACKHAIASLLVLADEVTIDPGMLVTWRSGAGERAPSPSPVTATSRVPAAVRRPDPLAGSLRAPRPLPELPHIAPLAAVPMSPGEHDVAVLIDAAIALIRRPPAR